MVGFEERKAVRVIEQFLIARRALYETVYHHKTVRAAEGMMSLFLRRLRQHLQEERRLEVPALVEPMVSIINGDALSPDKLLSLDDYAVFVLVDIIAGGKTTDGTLHDLANRLRSRDLFKLVPLLPKDVTHFLSRPSAHEELYDIIEPFCPGDPEFYLVQDDVSFSMLSDRKHEQAMLIRDNGSSTACNGHPELRDHHGYERDEVRLFTVREAVSAVVTHIKQSV